MKRGAPTKYNPETTPKRVADLSKAGARDVDIAKELGISRATLNNWEKKYPELLDTLKEGKEEVDKKVVCALLKNALGYTVTETKRYFKPLFSSNGDPVIGNDGKQVKALIREEVTDKEVQPSTVAQIFWLKNRQPQDWRQNVTQTDWEKSKGEVIELFNRMKEDNAQPPAR